MAIQRSVVIRLVADVHGMSAGMADAERSVTRLDRRVAAMTRAVRAAAAESAQASERVAAAKRVEATMTERAAAAEQRATSVRAAASAAATRVGEAEARLADVRAAGTAEMATRVTAAEERVTSVRRQAEAAASRVGQAEARLAELRAGGANVSAAELSAAERRVEQARATAAAAADRVGIAESRLAELRAASGASAAEVAAAERRVEAARARHQAVTNAAASAEQRLTAAQEMQARAAAQVTAAEERATAATNAHAAAAQRSIARTQAWNAAAGKMAMVGGTIGLGLGLAVKQFMDFDEAMSGVRANLSGTPAEMDAVQNAVRQAGAASVFSATEAANAAEELAKAGLSAADITGGALTGSLDLAAAGSLGLARAAEISATAMAQFHLKGQDVAHIADVMAAAALGSTADVETLAQGMAQGGGMAASLGMSLEDTAATLALFDQNALKGSDGGTSLKTMLMSLTPNSLAAATAMEDIGLQAFDANGKFVGLTTVAEQLKNGMKDMGEEQRLAALKTIFGADAARAANVLYQEGAAGLQKYIDMVSKSGVAQQVAAAKLNNAKGDLEKLKGAISDVLIGAGENADGMIRPLIQNVEKLVSAFGSLPSGMQSSIVQLAAFGSAGLLAGAGAIKVVNTIRGMSSAISASADAFRTWATMGNSSMTIMQGLSTRARNTGTAFRDMGTKAKVGAGLAAGALAAVALAASTSGTDLENAGRQSSQLALDLEKVGKGGDGLDAIFKDMQIAMDTDRTESFADALGYVGDNSSKAYDTISSFTGGLGKFVGAGKGAVNETEAIKARLKGVGDELGKMVSDGRGTEAASIFKKIADAAKEQGVSTEDLMKMMPAYSDALNSNSSAAAKAKKASEDDAKAKEKQKQDVQTLVDAYKNLNNVLLQQEAGQDAALAAVDAADKALQENGRTLDANSEKGRANRSALRDIVQQYGEWASSVYQATNSQAEANAILQDGKQKWIEHRVAITNDRAEAERMADTLFKLKDANGNPIDIKADSTEVKAAHYDVNTLGEEVVRLDGSKIEIPADTPNAPQVLQTLTALGLTAKQLSSDGTKVSIPTEALKAPETRAAIMGIEGATKDAQGNVTIPTSALSADATRNALKQIDNIALQADGRVVIIPSSAPNAPAVKAILEQVSGAAYNADSKSVSIPAESKNAPWVKKLLDQVSGAAYNADSKSVSIPAEALTATALANLQALYAAAHDKTVTITTVNRVINESVGNNQRAAAADRRDTSARGNVFLGAGAPVAFARGGVREDHEPQIARPTPGRVRVWAEPETQGEAYIPFANDGRRGRAKSITEYVARRFGGSVTWHADGSADDWTPDMSGIMAYAASLKVDPSALTDQRKKVADQSAALNKAIRDLKAAQAGVRGKSGAARVKAENAVATAMERQAKAQRDLNDGRAKLNQMSAGAKADTTTRFMQATGQQNGLSQRFLDNIERIRKRGFPRLARSLLEQGDSDAQAIAQTLSGGSLDRLKSAQAGLDTSDKLADRKAQMLDDLKGVSTGEVADQAQAQANAQLIAMQAANQRIAWASGPTTARLEARLDVLADAIRSQPAPIVQASPVKVITQLDSRPIAESTFGHGARESQWGSVLPGIDGGW